MQNISRNLLSKLGLCPKNNLYTVQFNLEHVVPFERTALKLSSIHSNQKYYHLSHMLEHPSCVHSNPKYYRFNQQRWSLTSAATDASLVLLFQSDADYKLHNYVLLKSVTEFKILPNVEYYHLSFECEKVFQYSFTDRQTNIYGNVINKA